jgi:hypothetical protein
MIRFSCPTGDVARLRRHRLVLTFCRLISFSALKMTAETHFGPKFGIAIP